MKVTTLRDIRTGRGGGLSVGLVDHQPPPPSSDHERFTTFVIDTEPRLRRALAGAVGIDRANDAVASALTWAWEHWDQAQSMENLAGYLYRVGRSSVRVRPLKRVRFLVRDQVRLPDVEPGLNAALGELTDAQRHAVWLVHACEWTYAEAAEALGISASAVGTHVSRGLEKLRTQLGANHD